MVVLVVVKHPHHDEAGEAENLEEAIDKEARAPSHTVWFANANASALKPTGVEEQ
jgi:hypothetical protein